MNDLAVLIPAYKANDTIVRCLKSLRAQTFQGFDIILLVDGWPEEHDFPLSKLQECYGFFRKTDKAISQGHHGIAYTRNRLLEYAQEGDYKYVAWQDADDESEPERLRLQVEYLEAHPEIFMVGTWIIEIEDETGKGRIIRTPTNPHKIREGYYGGQQAVSGATAMFRLHSPWRDEHGKTVGGIRFREDLPIGEDTVFNLEVQKRWPLCQANIGQHLYRYHRQPGGGAVRRYRAEAKAGRAVPIDQFMKECVEKYG